MKDEIKEILNRLDYNEWEVDLYKVPIQWSELYDIRDYITNLQEENEILKEENIKLYKKDTKIINELKEELQITQEKWDKDKQFSKCRTMEMLDYKSRNERTKSLTNRTIEIIKQQPSGNDEWILERLNGINYCLGSDE